MPWKSIDSIIGPLQYHGISPVLSDRYTLNNSAISSTNNHTDPPGAYGLFNEREAILMRNYVENMALWVRNSGHRGQNILLNILT